MRIMLPCRSKCRSSSTPRVRTKVARIEIDESHRARLPVHTPSVIAGVKGGIAGGAAMIVPALLYGLIRYHSIWYAINLLGGAGVAGWTNPTLAEITHFRLSALITATIIHAAGSLLIGLLYGAMLPMLPQPSHAPGRASSPRFCGPACFIPRSP